MKKAIISAKIFLAVVGALLVIAGLACILNPMAAISSVASFIGIILMVAGAATVIFYFMVGGIIPFSWIAIVEGVLEILVALLFLKHPDTISTIFVILFGLALIGTGLLISVVSFLVKAAISESKFWLVILALGVLSLFMGGVCLGNTALGGAILAVPLGIMITALGAVHIFLDVKLIKAGKTGEDKKYFTDVDNKYYTDVDD